MVKNILPLLIDFDGIIKIAGRPAPGAQAFLKFVRDQNIPAIILSNSTLYTGQSLLQFLRDFNLDYGITCITAADAALQYVQQRGIKISAYCNKNIEKIFSDFLTDKKPDAVLIGDLEDRWDYNIMNEIFRKVHGGAEIIAMQKNKFWKPADKLCLDAGAFIAAIEYASGKEAQLIGKPSPLYFQTALDEVVKQNNLAGAEQFIIVGDDIENDIDAAQKINGIGILVYTGKTKYPPPPEIKIEPQYSAKTLNEVIPIIEKIIT